MLACATNCWSLLIQVGQARCSCSGRGEADNGLRLLHACDVRRRGRRWAARVACWHVRLHTCRILTASGPGITRSGMAARDDTYSQ